jgi:hypothetical protein
LAHLDSHQQSRYSPPAWKAVLPLSGHARLRGIAAAVRFDHLAGAPRHDASHLERPRTKRDPIDCRQRLALVRVQRTYLAAAKSRSAPLVTGLNGTGSDPPPTPQRAALLAEMNRRGVDNPNALLASGTTSLVLVRGMLRPGIQPGDRFDVEVRIPSQSETTSIRDGSWKAV